MAERTDRQRRFAFAGLVVVLALVGIYLTLPSSGTSAPHHLPSVPPTTGTGPVTAPPGISSTITAGNFNIYQLLPLSQNDFATAANLAQRFVIAYGTFRYDEDPSAYQARLQPLVTAGLLNQLSADAAAPGVAQQRQQSQEISTASATVNSIRNFEANSVIFLVTGQQQITENGQQTQSSQQYAVTVSRDSNLVWRVYAFDLADVGQAGGG